ncbi:vancomycin B-type resistance protein VanW [Andreesenia angusta]|uniref:Vancomycin B-type resistance protein VanW n=1 Tax=Andreesenia angusta TaxID=39480 RepID=A0A1S1V6Q5_9FIRM|nr:VanW family protein [Andreesenia angusta]OHW62326.1 vancomycin B-type resistance protein VanW [Andreesenia angusta]
MKRKKIIAIICTVPVILTQLGFANPEPGVEQEKVQEKVEVDLAVEAEETGYKVLQNGVELGTFGSLKEAIAEAVKWANSVVEFEGEAVWRFGDQLYKVYQGEVHLSNWTFSSKSEAVAEAVKWNNSHIAHNGEIVWRFGDHKYRVMQGKADLGLFNTKAEAIAEAVKWNNSTVVHEGSTVWKFGDHKYRVMQGKADLGLFNTKAEAIAEAVKWNNSTVVHEGSTVWKFGDHKYRVMQGKADLGLFNTKAEAIAEAVKWNKSTVVYQGSTVWKFGDHKYRVLQAGVSLGLFDDLSSAIAEGNKWRNSVIVKDGATVWKFGQERLLGSYTTYFSARDTNRNYNIALSARSINGRTVAPGTVFSFNGATGLKNKANGYRESIVISGGKFVLGVGGGVCQTSSTLYNAVLNAGLQVVERHPHSQPVSYVPRGRDATVADYALDFKFRNNTSYPLKIKASTTSNSVTVSIYGM